MHEPDHADDEDRGGEHDPAFEDVGVELGAGDDDCAADAGGDCRAEGPEDGGLKLGPANLGEIGEDDAHDERRFDALRGA
jgi:hypothetical protein